MLLQFKLHFSTLLRCHSVHHMAKVLLTLMKMDASAGETIFFCMFECPTIIISSNNVNLEISTLCELVTVALNSKNWKMKIFSPVYNV